MSSLESLLNDELLKDRSIIITGDINIDLLDINSRKTIDYVNFLHSFHFMPIIDKITRYSTNREFSLNGTILDHVFINKPVSLSAGVILHSLSDHCPTFGHFLLNLRKGKNATSKQKVVFRPFTDAKLDLFAGEIGEVNWNVVIGENLNANESFEKFQSLVSDVYCRVFPLKTKFITVNRINKPWITNELVDLSKKKSEYLNLYRLGVISKETNNTFKNFVTAKVRKAEHSYYLRQFKNFNRNMKHSWDVIKRLTGRTNSLASTPVFLKDSHSPEEKLAKMEQFNDFFSNIGNVLDSQLGQPNHNLNIPNFSNPNSFFFHPVTDNEIDKIIVNMKMVKSGLNVVPIKIFKSLRHLFLHPLRLLINKSFEEGTFPNSLKLARITPIHKQGDYQDPSNFRPISSLPYISKILEMCVKSRLLSFCSKFSLISPVQYGFQRGKSTCDALVHITELIYKSLNDKNHQFAIMIDLRKAFDSLNHNILLRKLERSGVRGNQLQWFSSYLSNRKCYLEVQDLRSTVKTFNIGVPQGSVLGPVLFLLYINDIAKISDKLSTTLFADDTTVAISDPCFDSLISNTNTELGKLHNWTVQNRLNLNVSKTMLLFFTNRNSGGLHQRICLGGEPVNHVQYSKFLGVFLDEKLDFVPHINSVCSKISKHSGILYKIKDKLTTDAKLSYYYALIYPYLSYNVCIWGSTYPTHLQPLIVQQKRVVRIIAGSHYLAHTRPLFLQLGLLEFMDVYRFNVLNNVHRCLSRGDLAFKNSRCNRDPFLIKPEFHRLTLTQHAFSYVGPTEWNKLPMSIRQIENQNTFKRSVKQYFLSQYEDPT